MAGPPAAHKTSARRKVLIAASPGAGDYLREIAPLAREQAWHLATDMLFTGSFPRNWSGDGILAFVGGQPELLACIQSSGIPCVAVPLGDPSPDLPRVEVDNAEIGRVAADHFLARGYRNFAWAPFTNGQMNSARRAGFQAHLAQHGHPCHCLPPRHVRIGPYWQYDRGERRRDLVVQLQRLPRPTAVFACNDCVAAEIIDACADVGIPVPEDIAVLGTGNDFTVCESTLVSLSSIDPDLKNLVLRAAGLLELMMAGASSPPQLLRTLPHGVVARMSTDVRAVANPRIACALSYIAENYPNPMLSVTDVANAVGMSRRHLERSFREETNSTVNEHIVRARMLEASRLLKTHPRAKSSNIAELVGLGGAGTFHRTFRRVFGMSPSAHRHREPGSKPESALAIVAQPTGLPAARNGSLTATIAGDGRRQEAAQHAAPLFALPLASAPIPLQAPEEPNKAVCA